MHRKVEWFGVFICLFSWHLIKFHFNFTRPNNVVAVVYLRCRWSGHPKNANQSPITFDRSALEKRRFLFCIHRSCAAFLMCSSLRPVSLSKVTSIIDFFFHIHLERSKAIRTDLISGHQIVRAYGWNDDDDARFSLDRSPTNGRSDREHPNADALVIIGRDSHDLAFRLPTCTQTFALNLPWFSLI